MINESILDRALAAYLGFACGDALGATVEFMSPRSIQKRYGVHREIIGGGWLNLQAGQVTDDTQMSLAIGEAIIQHQGWNIQAVADNFVEWLASEPPDIGNTCRAGILRYQQTGELSAPPDERGAGNGACMRNLPVALATLYNPIKFETWSLQQSHITHNNPLSDGATLALGRKTQALIKGEELNTCQSEIDTLLKQYPQFNYHPYPGKSSAYIVDTLQTVLHYFYHTQSFEECLIATVNQGQDADTTGALAGMLAGAHYGLSAIPSRWLDVLDGEIYQSINRQCRELLKLAEKAGSARPAR